MFWSLLALLTLASACALLSIFVVHRRWAFLGEGIAHAGFGGAGTVWLAASVWPFLDQSSVVYTAVIVFCLLCAAGIGALSRRGGVSTDAAIGIFLVASLAWGFLGQQIYASAHHGLSPSGFETLLFGRMQRVEPMLAVTTAAFSLGVIGLLVLLWRPILLYTVDPEAAAAAGVPEGLIHYLMVLLTAVMIILSIRFAGSVLATAMLVLPGAAGLLRSRRISSCLGISLLVGLCGAAAGPLVHQRWQMLPIGPIIVLSMAALFVLIALVGRRRA